MCSSAARNISGAGFGGADICGRKGEAEESIEPEPRDVGVAVRQRAERVTTRQPLEYVERVVEEADLVPFGEKQLERFSGKAA